MTSSNVRYGLFGSVEIAIGEVPTSITGAKSFSVSKGRLWIRNGFTAWVSNTNT
jgi:hypothetical protein